MVTLATGITGSNGGAKVKIKRGQLNIMAVAAVALVVLFIILYSSMRGSQDSKLNQNNVNAGELKDKAVIIEQTLDQYLSEAINELAFEMGKHGGFTAENVPKLNHFGKPYFFYKGHITNIPSVAVMEQMMAKKAIKRVQEKIFAFKDKTSTGQNYEFGVPEIVVRFTDDMIEAKMKIHIEIVSGDESTIYDQEFTKQIGNRIKSMRDLAEKYINGYAKIRRMESSILNSITHDERIPNPPGALSKTISCEDKTVYKHYRQLVTPIQENTKLAVAMELLRIKKSNLNTNMFEWSNYLNQKEVEYTFISNDDEPEYRSEETIYFVPIPFGFFDMRESGNTVCISKFLVSYTVYFPVKYTITDIMPTRKVTGGHQSVTVTSQTFEFFMMPLLIGEDIFATNTSVHEPQGITDFCTGSCKLDLRITNARQGNIHIDTCTYKFSSGSLVQERVPCGVHTLVVEPSDNPSLSTHIEEVNIIDELNKEITLKKKFSFKGSISLKKNIYCKNSKIIKDAGTEPLTYIAGDPPAYVQVIFTPLSSELPVRDVLVDEKGKFVVEDIIPGDYIMIALPSTDNEGTPTYKVEPYGEIIHVDVDEATKDIVMDPMGIQRVGDIYEHVYSTENC